MTPMFWARVDADADCWIWTGTLDRDGYGQFNLNGRKVRAHRGAFEALVGLVPPGLVLDHLCRVRACVNPDHLEPVTNAENIRRGFKALARHCLRGHEYTPENTLIHRRPDGSPRRQCRRCWAGYFRKYRAQRKAALRAA